jgi:hypothetical protein
VIRWGKDKIGDGEEKEKEDQEEGEEEAEVVFWKG